MRPPVTFTEHQILTMSEQSFQDAVIDLANMLRIRSMHINRSKVRDRHTTAVSAGGVGWPDLTLVGRGGALFRELKTERGRVRPEQREWIAAMNAAGLDAAVWRPRDLVSGLIVTQMRAIARPRPNSSAPPASGNPVAAAVAGPVSAGLVVTSPPPGVRPIVVVGRGPGGPLGVPVLTAAEARQMGMR